LIVRDKKSQQWFNDYDAYAKDKTRKAIIGFVVNFAALLIVCILILAIK